MCHEMTSLAVGAGRLGAKTFCMPRAGISKWTDRLGTRFLGRYLGSNQVRSVPSSFDGE